MSDDITRILDRAFESLRAGKVGEAWSLSEGILSQTPGHAGALQLSGLSALMGGRVAEGRARLEEAVLRAPNESEAWRNLGTARLAEGDEEGTIAALSRALDLRPGYLNAALSLSDLLGKTGDLAKAAKVLEPFRTSLEAMTRLGSLGLAMGDFDLALEMADQCQSLEGGEASSASLVIRGQAYLGLGRSGEAAELFRHALALEPTRWPARLGLGAALAKAGNWMAASRALGANVADYPALALLADSLMPPVLDSHDDIDAARGRLRDRLADLRDKAAFIPDPNSLVGGLAHPLLATQGRDDLALLSDVADTLRVICPVLRHQGEGATNPRPAEDGRRRVGILSHRFHDAEGDDQAGLVEGLLGRKDLEVTLFSSAFPKGPRWERLSAKADRAIVLPRDVLRANGMIAAERLEVMLFPELGTDDFTMALAHGRHAPVQCALAGHPETSGLPSIDYFVVGEVLEGPGSQAQYREQLARLPGALMTFSRPVPIPADRAKLNLPREGTLYLCAQRASKIHPDMDGHFARILKGDPKGWLCLFRDREPALTERLSARLKSAGLPMERVVWLRRTRHGVYLAALAAVDVVLDTLHWGGGLTGFEALAMGRPPVTLQGTTLRARRTAGLCRMLGVTDTVARTEDAYARLALSLGKDPAKRSQLALRASSAAATLVDDTSAIEALAAFLIRAEPLGDDGAVTHTLSK